MHSNDDIQIVKFQKMLNRLQIIFLKSRNLLININLGKILIDWFSFGKVLLFSLWCIKSLTVTFIRILGWVATWKWTQSFPVVGICFHLFQSSEAEDDQLTPVCASSCFKSGAWYWWTRGMFTSPNFSSGEHHPHLGSHLCTVL